MIVEFFRRSVYGQEVIYPTGQCEEAVKALRRGCKTITSEDLRSLSKLGLEIREVNDPRRVEVALS
jgi:hypothetical protein|tara:strand:- start:1082 stop:1279 length:198 start_codon:yes stop_codon:yes gene_type:complete